jgi:hypothetical protein
MSNTFFTRSGGDPMTEEQMRREVKRLIKTGKMPTLEELSAAVLEARKKYANKIRRARGENREDTAALIAQAMRSLE